MRLALAETKYFKDSISIISDLVTEARFKVTKSSLELVAMDPANVAMVIFKLLSSSFTEYKLDKDIDIAINLNNFKQILRRAGPNDMLSIELEDNKLKIQLKGSNTRTFSLPLIDIEDKEQKIPDLNFPVSIVIPSSMLNDAIDDADIVSESVSFMAEANKMVIEAKGDLSHAKTEIISGEDAKINIEGSGKIKSKYSVEYLKKMITASKLSDNVSIYFNKDYPLKLDYRVMDKLQMAFILAPRVENE